jgi:hypothetical protein
MITIGFMISSLFTCSLLYGTDTLSVRQVQMNYHLFNKLPESNCATLDSTVCCPVLCIYAGFLSSSKHLPAC